MEKYLVYLSGPITGLTYGGAVDWRDFASQSFPPHVIGVSPLRAERYLNNGKVIDNSPQEHQFPMLTDRAINARDKFDTLRAKVILVNLLGATRVSIGTMMEIAWAHDHNIPVIVAMEPEGNLHDHPMVRDCITVRVASLEEAIEIVVAFVGPQEKHIFTNIEQVRMLREESYGDVNVEPRKDNFNGGIAS